MEDPFIIETCPHVYYAGNQKKFASRLVKGEYAACVKQQPLDLEKQMIISLCVYPPGSAGQQVRLICIPKFSETGAAVLVRAVFVAVLANVCDVSIVGSSWFSVCCR